MSERCDSCKVGLDFPTAREVLDKKRTCPACGHTQRVEKSILYVVETLEERHEWLDERLQVIEAQLGIVAREKPQPVPRKRPVIHPPLDLTHSLYNDETGVGDKLVPKPSVDLFADVLPTPAPVTTLPDIF